jgi:hypothetical protein
MCPRSNSRFNIWLASLGVFARPATTTASAPVSVRPLTKLQTSCMAGRSLVLPVVAMISLTVVSESPVIESNGIGPARPVSAVNCVGVVVGLFACHGVFPSVRYDFWPRPVALYERFATHRVSRDE